MNFNSNSDSQYLFKNAQKPLKLTLGISPCPNDCFIFDAIIHNKIDTEGLEFEVFMEDVESLNQKAFNAELDITKLSFNAYAYLTKPYQLLNSGSALGKNCGPLLIAKDDTYLKSPFSKLQIAIPGKYTTANLLLSLAYPEAKNKVEMLFSDIEDALISGKVQLGLIIHENRFTFEQKGLKKIIDLGEYWEKLTNTPIPLGGIVIKRNFPDDLKHKFNRILRNSIAFAFANPISSRNFVKANAQSLSDDVIFKHIELYVNNYSLDLGVDGKQAFKLLYDKAQEKGLIKRIQENIFL